MAGQLGIRVQHALWDSERGNKESDQWIKFIIPQDEWMEAARLCRWVPGEVQVAITVDWGDGKQNIGIAVYNGHSHTKTGGAGGFSVSFQSDIKSLEWDTIFALKRACAGKTEDEQSTFELIILTVAEAQEMLKRRKKKQSLADVIQEESDAETDGEEGE